MGLGFRQMSSKVKQIHLASESNVRRHFFWFSTLFSADNVGNVLALMFAVSFHSVEQTVISWIRKSLEYENWSTIFTYVFSHFYESFLRIRILYGYGIL